MKVCAYCGRHNDEAFTHCSECGTQFDVEKAPTTGNGEELPARRSAVIKLDELPGSFNFKEGFSRQDWMVIAKAIEGLPGNDSRRLAWDDVTLQWVDKLAGELGGGYRVLEAERCLLVSDLEQEAAKRLLHFSTSAIDKISESLGGIAWEGFEGFHVILILDEEDDYYQYLSAFYSDGEHPKSAGVHIREGLPHIACLYHRETTAAQTIVHELVHHSIHHLPVPTWLHEGLAVTIERIMNSQGPRTLTFDLPEGHHRFWNENTIQRFWAGTSFDEPGESNELSYSLAEVLLHLLAKKRQDFLAFVRAAHYDDAGQTAALDCLSTCLGEAVGTFLGPGNWRPQRKAIKECWKAARKRGEGSSDQSDD